MASTLVCTVCGYVGRPVKVTKGSFLIEIILWCFLIVPGLIYSIWRLTSQQAVCPRCKNPSMIPTDTPMGAKLVQAPVNAQPVTSDSGPSSSNVSSMSSNQAQSSNTLKLMGIGLLVLIAWPLWFLTLPAILAWYVWKKTKLSTRTKGIVIVAAFVVFIATNAVVAHAYRTPTLAIADPKNNTSVQANSITVQGRVDPVSSAVTVNGHIVVTGNDGSFHSEVALPGENNPIQIVATNHGNTSTVSLNVVRIFTEAEKAEQARLKAEADAKQQAALQAQQKAQEEAAAKAKADQAAYDASPAGRLCKKHPDWTKDDCEALIAGKIRIGMTLEQFEYVAGGKPDSIHPSNYGSGVQYQFCWTNGRFFCAYSDSDELDAIITSYN